MKPSCAILIPTYNGRDILAECLPSVVEAVEKRGAGDEIVILDNDSEDDTVKFIGREFPTVRVMQMGDNLRIFAINVAAREIDRELLFFLNNDMIVSPGFLDPMLEHFAAPDVFAVTGKVLQWDRRTVQGCRRRAVFSKGWFWYVNDLASLDRPGITCHALGGQSAYRREMFLALGCFDELFSPLYHEDLDITYRACKRGWKAVYEPRGVMYHKGAATAGKLHTRHALDVMMRKNMFLFIWKNIHDPRLWASHWAALYFRLIVAAARGDRAFVQGFFRALRERPAAMQRRAAAKAEAKLGDREALKILR
ncbi:MAG: glycosyltransferase [bacterium]